MIARAQGLKAWLIQRLSAVYMVLYFLYFGFHMLTSPPRAYLEWKSFIAAPAMSVATLLLFGLLLLHAWVGMRDVVMDYVHSYTTRLAVLVVIAVVLLSMGVWVLQVFAGVW